MKKKISVVKIAIGIFAIIVIIGVLNGIGESEKGKASSFDIGNIINIGSPKVLTYDSKNNEICKSGGKPIIRLFSTTWCPHCQWIDETYDRVVQEYVDAGKIVAYHWELDIKDDSLTNNFEGEIPQSELNIYSEFNPEGTVPTFVFGCKYSRIGNAYESQGESGLIKEEAEFRELIEILL